ncbi:Multidrug transporter EmrE [Vibrio stylophorae]|uniref:Multidrug transporter EmrE n=1 Tax=Vibrio stylophorae TaxID=659351 RepID=A0ABM8ZTL0_9VIBR|nr:multidrug efflux SMR transporter [Vibrio stylophorae]CAH0533650.1 Multidrug transporter EmrE [Vibrio stylophorae]
MHYVYLAIAIMAEVVATSALKASDSFTKLLPSFLVVLGYATSFYCLSVSLKTIDVGVAYAIWAGVGIVLITLVAAAVYRQIPDLAAVVGMSLIVAGVLVIQLFSKSTGH